MERIEFSARLNQALDDAPLTPPVPQKGRGRQRHVAKLFKVDQKAARKWLEGDGYPKMETVIVIAKKLQVAVEWLLTGRGEKRVMVEESSSQMGHVIDMWLKMRPETQDQWLTYGEYLLKPQGPQMGEKTQHRPPKKLQ